MLFGVIASTSGCQSSSTQAPVASAWFVEEAAQRGIAFQHISGYETRPLLPEIVGGGAALVDVEGDGDLDLYFVQSGWNLDAPPHVEDLDVPANELYINDGNGTFVRQEDIGEAAHRGYGMGVAVGDYDGDGDADLYVTNYGPNVLLNNDGNGVFEDVTELAGVDDARWSTAAAFSDFDADGDLDLFVVNYLHWTAATEIKCYARGELTYCLPTSYKAEHKDRLYRNNGNGTFTDVTRKAGLERAYGNGLGIVVADFDADGRIDVFVANDTMQNQLWLNQGGLKFLDEADYWGCSVDDHGIAKAGMGVDAVDVDDDSDVDLIVVNFEGQTDSFFRNTGQYFVDSTSDVGLGVGSRRFTRFGVVLADFDNDGVVDLYEANGKVDGTAASKRDVFAEPNMLFRGQIGPKGIGFQEYPAAGGVVEPLVHTSRGVALGDINNDGALDLVVVNRDAAPYLLINVVGDTGNWVRFLILDDEGQPAIGAKVTARVEGATLSRFVKLASSYLASHEPHVHFGLGSHEEVLDVQVVWPDGHTMSFGGFAHGALTRLHRDGTRS